MPRTSASLSWINSTIIVEDGLKRHKKRLALLENWASCCATVYNRTDMSSLAYVIMRIHFFGS
ncbi:hypothetical protein NXF25_007154 [Crotalus adamanteus]|uniref:Uncharacterized protein n=1 Tax=Crotalus adamanteus TaxID=8729 RepID=A0AAW1C1R4_CROAD